MLFSPVNGNENLFGNHIVFTHQMSSHSSIGNSVDDGICEQYGSQVSERNIKQNIEFLFSNNRIYYKRLHLKEYRKH